ncbi:MAG: protein-L-isoaspartate(D-aspartate) O-methyltransferase [Candidatus Thermoplasmatota archaeon]
MARSLSALVDDLVASGYVVSPRLEEAMRRVDRALFLPREMAAYAYIDSPLHIGHGQTISAPHMVAIMMEVLEAPRGPRCLEIGTGSGYHAALAAEMIGPEGMLLTIERVKELAATASENLEAAGYADRVKVIVGDGSLGYPPAAPYDRILVTCAAPGLPKPLAEQLADGGRAVVPIGNRYWQTLYAIDKRGGRLDYKAHGGCVFVPLIGAHGFDQ